MVKTARRHKKSWRSFQSDSQKRQRLILGIVVLTVIILVVLIGKLLSFVGALGQPFALDGQSSKRAYLWNYTSPINLVVKSQSVSVLSYDPVSQSLTIIKVPDEAYVQAALGYGSWPTRSIYQLGQSENNRGGELLKLTFAQTVGVPVDGYLIFKGDRTEQSIDTIIEELRDSPVSLLGILADLKTDLSLIEVVRLLLEIKATRFDKVNTIDLSQSQVTSWMLLSDGRRALEINQSLLDKTLASYLEDQTLSLEGVSVVVYNSTEHPGLAERAARMISNIGGRVVKTSVIQPPQEVSVIAGDDSYSKDRLGGIFAPACLDKPTLFNFLKSSGCQKMVEKLLYDNQSLKLSLEQGQLTIILGEEFYNKLNQKP